MKQRTAARVFLLNQQDQILLIRFEFPQSQGTLHFWATPGGGVEAGETPLAAAQRELREELDIRCLSLIGPIHHGGGIFEYDGHLVNNQDVFYAARWTGSTPTLTGVTSLERTAMKQARWWSHADLRATQETVYPENLADLLPWLAAQLQPAD